jgi:hypothetical protein
MLAPYLCRIDRPPRWRSTPVDHATGACGTDETHADTGPSWGRARPEVVG